MKNTICTMETTKMMRQSRNGCPCCGVPMKKGDDVIRIYTPYQQRGVNVHVGCYGKAVENASDANSNSNNCVDHRVTISNFDMVDVLYFTHYGFKKRNGYMVGDFTNAQSCGVTVANAIACGYTVKVNGKVVKTVAEYDHLTKAVCMR